MRLLVAALAAALLAGCASPPEPDAKGDGGDDAAVWGYVKLVPREGVAEATGGAHLYADRSLDGVQLVDYSTPGFAVVYVDGEPPRGEQAVIGIAAGPAGVRLDPPHAALAVGGSLRVTNQSDATHAVSCPAAGLVRALPAGQSVDVAVTSPGEWSVFLLDVPGEQARVFAAPGPYQTVSPAGRFEIEEVPPGRVRVHAWHPRFPGASRAVELVPNDAVRVDFELRVDRMDEERESGAN